MCEPADGPSVGTDAWPRASKPHVCCACREPVEPGERYHYYSGCWGGRWSTFKHCARCWLIVEHLWATTQEPVVLTLDCGEIYEPHGDDDPALELAFMSREDGQRCIEKRLLRAKTAR